MGGIDLGVAHHGLSREEMRSPFAFQGAHRPSQAEIIHPCKEEEGEKQNQSADIVSRDREKEALLYFLGDFFLPPLNILLQIVLLLRCQQEMDSHTYQMIAQRPFVHGYPWSMIKKEEGYEYPRIPPWNDPKILELLRRDQHTIDDMDDPVRGEPVGVNNLCIVDPQPAVIDMDLDGCAVRHGR